MARLLGSISVALLALLAIGAAPAARAQAGDAAPVQAKQFAIVTRAGATPPELKAAEILGMRLAKRSGVQVSTAGENDPAPAADVVVVIGTPEGNSRVAALLDAFHTALPTLPNSTAVHPESFAVKSGIVDGVNTVLIAGADGRAAIYGAGWLMREMTYLPDAVLVPAVDIQDKPAFWLRGGNPHGPGSRAREFAELRPQTHEEYLETMEDQMLLGTNVFGGDPDAMRGTYGMMTSFGRTANEMPPGFPQEWGAEDGRETKYVCPSVPEARAALLQSFDDMFRDAKDYDFFTTNSGDEGGCRCERCMPWGDTYIKLMHEIADRLHKYHPNCKILATNQDLTNEGDQAIMDYLNSGDSSWLYAIRYGPGADEMQTYIRGDVNPKWFEYEGFGELGNYLKFMYHELPRTTAIALYSDITHWMQAQYAVPHPDITLAAVYDRRSWNARPKNFHKVGQEILHYAIGDMHYSEGMHDDFNKWFWYRMLWNPNQSAEDLTREYCRYWFGPEAEEEMTQAIFLMEETLENPVLGNPGIDQAVQLTRAAGGKIPENLLRNDWRWRVISEKALMDRYIQMELEHGGQMKAAAAHALSNTDAAPRERLEKALAVLAPPNETEAMAAIRDEAKARGEESNQTFGYREPVVFIVDRYDLAETGWWAKTLQDALDSGDENRMRNAIPMVLRYEDPGEGGYYDDPGWPSDSAHLVQGHTLWAFRPLFGPARHSQYNLAYAYLGQTGGVAFAYDGLDPAAQYAVRISVGGPSEGGRMTGIKITEYLAADGARLGDDFQLPADAPGLFEFDIPLEATGDGSVRISIEPGADSAFPVAAAAEIWLLRKDKMPWTARP